VAGGMTVSWMSRVRDRKNIDLWGFIAWPAGVCRMSWMAGLGYVG